MALRGSLRHSRDPVSRQQLKRLILRIAIDGEVATIQGENARNGFAISQIKKRNVGQLGFEIRLRPRDGQSVRPAEPGAVFALPKGRSGPARYSCEYCSPCLPRRANPRRPTCQADMNRRPAESCRTFVVYRLFDVAPRRRARTARSRCLRPGGP
jgi:hypothetical protein